MALEDIIAYSMFGNTMGSYFHAVVVFAAVFISLYILRYVLLKSARGIAGRTRFGKENFFTRLVRSIGLPLYFLVALYLAVKQVVIPIELVDFVDYAFFLVAVFYVVRSFNRLVDFSTNKVVEIKKKKDGDSGVDTGVVDIFRKLVKIAAWVAALLFIIYYFGYDISGAMLGLGVTGIVVGFALQSVLADLFASFSIYFDRPFQIGDFIVIGDDLGSVTKVGLRSTRIKHLKGQELIVPNSELSKIRINNYGKMEKRRISFTFGVTYDTPSKKLEAIPGIVKDIINGVKFADADRVHFKEYGDSALIFEVVYFVATGDYNKYMDIQEKINLGLKRMLEKMKVEFAYPTQTLYVKKSR
ncbi:MAG: mechanosensitive ion channel family protein [Candidatus Aenigmarchaeota archaeon]|nr:mechanosensitive ion channel family protein [Candidatus Aenigmarchaeota archaeon]